MRPAITEYKKRLDHIQNKIRVHLGEQPAVLYSAYESDARELPIDNLDDTAVHGSVQFHAEHDPFWGDGKAYVSSIIDSPSWLDVSLLANEMIKTTGDYHHRHLESVHVLCERDGVKIARFGMGS